MIGYSVPVLPWPATGMFVHLAHRVGGVFILIKQPLRFVQDYFATS